MSSFACVPAIAAGFLVSVALPLALASYNTQAAEPTAPAIAPCSCPDGNAQRPRAPWTQPNYAEARPTLHASDEVATLQALQVALTEVGDGSAYVWQRHHGRLSGVVQPTASFKDASGKVCRHIVLQLSSGGYTRHAEGIACRLANGGWKFDG